MKNPIASALAILAIAVSAAVAPASQRNEQPASAGNEHTAPESQSEMIGYPPNPASAEGEDRILLLTKAAFAEYDTDTNGIVSEEELPKAPEWKRAFSALDIDQSGGLSFDEARKHFEALVARRFERLDSNKDGILSPVEVAPKNSTTIIDLHMARDNNGDHMLTLSELANQGDFAYFEGLHLRSDTNGDDLVSRTELTDEYRRRAMLRDADQNDIVTLEEYIADQTPIRQKTDSLLFQELDRDADGRLTANDLSTKRPDDPVASEIEGCEQSD